MAGIYIHIPYCKQACHYCDFHFSTNLNTKTALINCIVEELRIRSNYIDNETIDTIYFGGGTPSIATKEEIAIILEQIHTIYNIGSSVEITLEANPDDLKAEKLQELKSIGINRLSIGVQSFNEQHLKYLNRAHNSTEAANCVKLAQNYGFDNISIDLIYGIPSADHSIWENDLTTAIELGIKHISAYCLTIEEKTTFGNWLKKGKIPPIEDEFSAQQFEMLLISLEKAGFEQYEISNFSLPELHSRHNSNYWNNINYLGVGPGAHSFNGLSRQYNITNNSNYIKGVSIGTPFFDKELLTAKDLLNEYIMVRIRTKWGIDLKEIHNRFHIDLIKSIPIIDEHLSKQLLLLTEGRLTLSGKGKLVADKITLDMFFE